MKRKVIALTGKIGSGKSAVATILRNLGYKIIDCDDLAKEVAANPRVIARVEQLLGGKSVVNGQLDRKYIRETVFSDKNLLIQYQDIFFESVRALLLVEIALLDSNDITEKASRAVFVEIPVLDAFEFYWDEVWRVESSEQNSISRVVARDKVSEESVLAMLKHQKTYDCTIVIENSGSLDELTQAVKVALVKRHLM